MNVITVAGNVTRDSELRQAGQDNVLAFAVADNQGKDKPAIFWECALWGKRGESLQQYISKGQAVTVSGVVLEREFTDKDGNQRKAMSIKVQEIALQGGRKEEAAPQRAPAQRPAPARTAPAKAPAGGGFEDMEDDIPF